MATPHSSPVLASMATLVWPWRTTSRELITRSTRCSCCGDRPWRTGAGSRSRATAPALDGGGTASRRIHPSGKGMAQMLLNLKVVVPREIAAAAEAEVRQRP
jgi:hypothetical protein